MPKLLKIALVALLLTASAKSALAAPKTIRLDEITIEGQIQKPQASYILQRSGKVDLGVDVRSLKPVMTGGYKEMLDREPELFRTDRR